MAYADFKEDEEDLAGGPAVPGGAGGPLSPSARTAGSAGPQGAKPKGSGQFADLGEYLRVNTPQEFGQQVAGKVGNEVAQGQQTLDNTSNEFKQRVDANTVRDTQGAIGQLETNPEGIDADYFGKLRDAQYKGPSSFAESQDLYNQASGAADTAVNKAKASKTEGGRFALLDNYFGRPNYTQGQKSLDNLLVQNDEGSQAAFDQVRQNAQALADNTKNVGQDLNAYAGMGRGTTEQTRNQARQAIGIDDAGNINDTGAMGAVKNSVKSQLSQRQADQAASEAALTNAFKTGDLSGLTPEQVKMFKSDLIFPSLGQTNASFWGTDPSKYLSKAGLTEQNVATPEQQRRLDVLSQLAGVENTYLPADAVGAFDTENPLSFDRDAFNREIRGKMGEYQTAAYSFLDDPKVTPVAKTERLRQLNRQWGLPEDYVPPNSISSVPKGRFRL